MTTLASYYKKSLIEEGAQAYDRAALRLGIAHIGVGAFHRAHQALYLERYNRTHDDLHWGILGIGLLPGDAAFLQQLNAQNGLYSLLLVDQTQTTLLPIGAIQSTLCAAEDSASAIAAMADSTIRIISMTITEGGYLYDFETDQFMQDHVLVQQELQPEASPCTIHGYLSRVLRRRMETGAGPVTLLSCDNVPGNGRVLERALSAFITLQGDQELLGWMQANVSFPNSMVDRITPTPTAALRQTVRELTGVDDQCPVLGEPFGQWVVEDNFIAGRPALEDVGVEFTPDVEHYEQLKLRILNGTHILISLLGYLDGLTYIHETMADTTIRRLARELMDKDAHPAIAGFSDQKIEEYKELILQRFSNPAIGDSVERVCSDGFNKLKNYLMPILRHGIAQGRISPLIALAFAAYAQHLNGQNDRAQPIRVNEPRLSADERRLFSNDVSALLRLESFFGTDQSPAANQFITQTETFFHAIRSQGVRQVIERL